MRRLPNIRLYRMHKRPASLLSSSRNQRDCNLLNQGLQPVDVVTEDVRIAGTGGVVIDDYVGVRGDGALGRHVADGVEEEELGDFVSVVAALRVSEVGGEGLGGKGEGVVLGDKG